MVDIIGIKTTNQILRKWVQLRVGPIPREPHIKPIRKTRTKTSMDTT